jgi:hypothetical protein
MKNFLAICSAFIRWSFGKLGERLLDTHRTFKKTIGTDFMLALLLWILGSLILGIGVLLGAALTLPIDWLGDIMKGYIILTFAYYVITCLHTAYECFVRDRQELFDQLKR